jgi:hypothetical protein
MADYPIPDASFASHIAMLGKTGSGKSNAAATLVERLLSRKERVCIIDPTDRYWGLRLSADGTKPSRFQPVIFGGAHGDLPLAEQHARTIAEVVGTTTTPTIISTRMMTVGERTRFFTGFAETLLRTNRGALHLVIDEAHLFAPQQGASGGRDLPALLHATNNLVSLGRGIGLRITLISQRPAKLHNDSLGQVETLIAFRLLLPHDRFAVRYWIKECADEKIGADLLASLPSLRTGEAWVWAPGADVLDRVHFPLVSTFDSGKPVPDGQGPTLAPIDLAALQGQLEAVASEALANDPARLKRRIAELEAEVRRRPVKPENLDQVLAAHDEGYQQGYRQGRAEQLAEDERRIRDRQAAIEAAARALHLFIGPNADDAPAAIQAPPSRPDRHGSAEGASPRVQPRRTPPPKRRSGLSLNGGESTQLPKGERAVLIAIAQHPIGVTRQQLTLLTGYKKSSRDAYVSRLAAKNFVIADVGRFFATAAGIAALGDDYEPLPTGDNLRAWWIDRLPEGERKVLETIVGYYPDLAERDEISDATGYKKSSRDAYISRLAARELVIATREGVRAAEELFG